MSLPHNLCWLKHQHTYWHHKSDLFASSLKLDLHDLNNRPLCENQHKTFTTLNPHSQSNRSPSNTSHNSATFAEQIPKVYIIYIRGGQRMVRVGVRSQNPEPIRPSVWDLSSVVVHFKASVTAVAGCRFLRSSG